MQSGYYPQSFLRPLAWVIVSLLLGGLVISIVFPLEAWRRNTFHALLIFYGIFLIAAARYSMSHLREHKWSLYLVTTVHILVIAIADYLLSPIDVSPLYTIVIIAVGVIADFPTALFAALLASVCQVWVQLSLGATFQPSLGAILRLALYFLVAYIVSRLTTALTERWRTAVVLAEQQRHESEERNKELEGLHRVSQAFGNLADTRGTFAQVSKQIADMMDAEICVLMRFDDVRSIVQAIAPGYGLGDEQINSISCAVTAETREFWDVDQTEYFFTNNLLELTVPIREMAQRLGARQLVAARMLRWGAPFGVVVVANHRGGELFREEDGRLLSILAGQAAIAVENTRLYNEAQTTLRDVTRLYTASTKFALQLNPSEIPQRVVHAIAQALDAPIATIALLNESTGRLEYAASLGVPPEALEVPFRENGVGMTVVRSGQPRFIVDVSLAEDISPVSKITGYRAVACLPIRRGAKILGLLYVNYAEPHVFSEIEKNILATFANQAAIALENARLLHAQQRKAAELAALATLSHRLAETMDLEEMFGVIEQQVRENLPATEGGALFIYDPQNDWLIARASFALANASIKNLKLRPGESILGTVFQTGQAQLFRGTEAIQQARENLQSENRSFLFASFGEGRISQSIICAPVQAGAERLGAIVLENFSSPAAFTPEDLRFLELLADRAALAIRNAQLYANGMRRAAQLSAVTEVGRQVTSILDLDKLLSMVTELIHVKFGYRHIHLFINDADKGESICRAATGVKGDAARRMPLKTGLGQGIIGWVAEYGQPILANDVSSEPRFISHPLTEGTCAELAVPLKIGSQCIGALDVQSGRVNAFEASDVATLETLAGQVAIAIENARLYGQVQEQARRDSLTQVYNHGYFLERLESEIDRSCDAHESLALIMLDIDFFKQYNDQYGHILGDVVLGVIVDAIRVHIKHTDLVGRWGGEEFVIALLNTDIKGALVVAERIRNTVIEMRLPQKNGQSVPTPTVSQGIATFPTPANTAITLIDWADTALYRAKAQGRNQVCIAGEEQSIQTPEDL